jgi:anhydro-N-acetylmuramic acid kinase
MSAHEYFIGLLSGTSIDGVDCALVDFAQTPPTLVATHSVAIPAPLRESILALCVDEKVSLIELGETDIALGRLFASAVNQLLAKSAVSNQQILAIGSHGQTIKHHPFGENRFTQQIGDPNTIALLTGICTITDFRRKDMAAGGQGAPLAPLFHQSFFADMDGRRAILNLGGIANVSLLRHGELPLVGFDTGPSNVLMDSWINAKQELPFDKDGEWARSGTVNEDLLAMLMAEAYLQRPAPKSTGRELFNAAWLGEKLSHFDAISDADVQASLLEFTARSIADSVHWQDEQIVALYACGGGAKNVYLMERLQQLIAPVPVASSTEAKLDPQWVESMTFAWFARNAWYGDPVDTRSVTGAQQVCIHGAIYEALSD